MPIKNSLLNDYYYQAQLRKYMIQFMAIFSGMQVSVGKNRFDSDTNLMRVPIIHGTKDRVVAAILKSNSPNIPVRLPIMSANIMSMQIAQDRMKGQGTTVTNVEFPRGGVFPDDLSSITKLMPIPYYIGAELNVLSSNLQQKFEILEQIFLLFRPDLFIQTSDDRNDWTAINVVQLNDINWENNYPPGGEARILSTSLQFQFLAYMSAPAVLRDNVINNIRVRIQSIDELDGFSSFEEEVASRPSDSKDGEIFDNIYDISALDPPEN